MTDFRSLCAELRHEFASLYSDMSARIDFNDVYVERIDSLLARARATLAQPEPVGPAGLIDDEIDEETETLIPWLLEKAVQAANSDAPYSAGMLTLAAQLLGERRPAVEPIPVSQRLPRPGDLNKDEEVWIWEPAFDYPLGDTGDYDIEPGKWVLRRITPFDIRNNRRWLPYWALPIPRSEERNDD